MNIEWYPGHMTKAMRQMKENLKKIDLILEIRDARIPITSANPDLYELTRDKIRICIFNKADLADGDVSLAFAKEFKEKGEKFLFIDARDSSVRKKILKEIDLASLPKRERDRKRGIRKSMIRIMALGIPNAGKSTVINLLAGKKSMKTGNRPGVTRGSSWIHLAGGYDLMDTPGVLWPKFSNPLDGVKLSLTGAVSDDVTDTVELSMELIKLIVSLYPGRLSQCYNIDETEDENDTLREIAVSRNLILPGGGEDLRRAALLLVNDLRSGSLGPVTLDRPIRGKI